MDDRRRRARRGVAIEAARRVDVTDARRPVPACVGRVARERYAVAKLGAITDAHCTLTINELFRPFAAGNTITQANPALVPEEAFGIEGSALVRHGRAVGRVTDLTRLTDAIVNVTLESSPTLIVRQRQNAGEIRAAGVELEGDARRPSYRGVDRLRCLPRLDLRRRRRS